MNNVTLNIFTTDAVTVGSGLVARAAWSDTCDCTQERSHMGVMCVVHAILTQLLWRAIKGLTPQKNLIIALIVICTSSLLTTWVDTGRTYIQKKLL